MAKELIWNIPDIDEYGRVVSVLGGGRYQLRCFDGILVETRSYVWPLAPNESL